MPSSAEARKQQRADRIAKGLCAEFGCDRLPVAGKRKCQVHLDAVAARARKAIEKAGIAGRCSHDATCDRPPAPGRKYCQYHLDSCKKATQRRYREDPTKQKEAAAAWYERRKADGICFASTKENPCDGHVPAGRVYCDKHNTENNLESRLRASELRKLVIETYGSKCQCCGETEVELLQVDHVDGGGNQHRREIGQSQLYRWLKKHGFPRKGFILLCGSCNWSWGRNGCCPHAKARLVTTTEGGVTVYKDPQTGKIAGDIYIATLKKERA